MSNLPATASSGAVAIRSTIEGRADEIRKLLPATMDYDKFSRVVYDALNRNRDLLTCRPQTVVDACASAARDGLLLDGREAALVIFKGAAQYIPMVAGIRKRIFNTGMVSAMQTGVVYKQEIESERFAYQEGTDAFLRHVPDLLWSPASGEEPVAAYSVVTMKDGTPSVEVMRWSEIMRVANLRGSLSPIWKTHKIEMARKTVLRRHAKSLPFSSDMFGSDDEPETIDADEPTQEAAEEAPRGRQRGAGAAAVRAARAAQEIPAHDEDGVIEDTTPAEDDAERDHLPTDDEGPF